MSHLRFLLIISIGFSGASDFLIAQTNTFQVDKRSRDQLTDAFEYTLINKREQWSPEETVLIICDMWDKHWCPDATARVAEMAPYLNEVAKMARDQGIFIIHAPSDVMDVYADHPARKRAIEAPKANNLPAEIKSWCYWIGEEEEKAYPIDQSDGGCESDVPTYIAYSKQIETIEIFEQDAISDSGDEVWNLMESRGIKNVMLVGVHTNMCVLGRPFGLRNMARYGKNVVLVRDLTDTMYNPKRRPFVDHYTGTDLIIEHIEKFVCPTITSEAITGRSNFSFAADERKK